MRTTRSLSFLIAGSMFLGPASAFAAGATTSNPAAEPAATAEADFQEEDLMNLLEESVTSPVMNDRGGGGYGGIIMPPYGNGGVLVDASLTKEVTPDFLALNAYCDSGKYPNREEARNSLTQVFNDIKNGVGKDGRVRRTGSVSVYPYYGPTGEDSGSYTANISIFIRITNPGATMRISDLVESKGCSANWDVRLVDTQKFELDNVDALITRLNKRKSVFEKLLGKKLTRVIGASMNTWVDSYGTYDPEVNKVDATTTLSVTFDLGTRASLPSTRSSSSATPRG